MSAPLDRVRQGLDDPQLAVILQERVQARLNDLGLTQITAATKAGLPRDTLRNLFRDRASLPRADTLVQIARALGVRAGFLLGEESAPEAPDTAAMLLRRARDALLDQVNKEDRELLALAIEGYLGK